MTSTAHYYSKVLNSRGHRCIMLAVLANTSAISKDQYVSDIVVRLGVQVDTVNNVLWSLTSVCDTSSHPNLNKLKSGQTISEACQVAYAQHGTISAYTLNIPTQIHNATRPESQSLTSSALTITTILWARTLPGSHTPSGHRFKSHIPVNMQHHCWSILNSKATAMGWYIITKFHDFELGIPILGCISPLLLLGHQTRQVVYIKPWKAVLLPLLPTSGGELVNYIPSPIKTISKTIWNHA